MQNFIKKILAVVLASILILGLLPGTVAEETKTPVINCYDFDLRFHLEADTFPFRERKYIQGYEELLDAIEFKGNFAYCPETDCMDLHVRVIPDTDPEAALEFRVFGWISNWLNVSSPLMGDKAVCFKPDDMLSFSIRAWDFFQIPLFHFAILSPEILPDAWVELAECWWNETEVMEDNTLTVEAMERIMEELRLQFVDDIRVTKLVDAATKPMADSGLALDEIHRLPDLLAVAADGQNLTMEKEKTDEMKDVRWLNHRGETIYRSHKTVDTFEEELTLPGSSSNYMPAYSFSSEKTEKEYSFNLDVSWDKVAEETPENENMPETLLRIKANIDRLPAEFPVDSDFSGRAKVEGIFLPNFDYLIHGVVAGSDGSVKLTLSNPDKPDVEPVFTVKGQFTPVSYGGPLEYMIGDIITDYSLFDLTDDTLAELVQTVFPAVMDKVPDFVYAIPTHSVQSILDTLEKYRLLQVLIK